MAEGNGSLGPISYLVVEFPGSKMTGEGLPILVDLVDQGVIRILDLVFVAKGQDGSLGIIGLAVWRITAGPAQERMPAVAAAAAQREQAAAQLETAETTQEATS